MSTHSLLLIPTRAERQWAGPLLDSLGPGIAVELCGFGPVVAGIRTAQLIAEYRPQRIWLLGIAGAFNADLDLGTAYEFDQVACYGIGVGCGPQFQSAGEMGWPQWPGASPTHDSTTITDCLTLDTSLQHSSKRPSQLLTVCSASASAEQAAWHKQKFPQAAAEDMEGFSVAAACALAQVPLRIIRGLSNMAGDRDHRNWQSAAAMRSAVELCLSQVEQL